MGVYLNGVDQSLGIKNTDAEMRDAVVSDATKFAGANLAELAAANLPADIDTLKTRLPAVLSAARIGYLDNINQAGLLQVTAARAALLDQITALRMAELDAANIPANIDTLLTRVTAAVALASVCTEARLAELAAANIPADIDSLKVLSAIKVMGRTQVFQKAVTSAANVGDVVLATITTQGCVIDSIVVKAVTAAQVDLTSAAVAGGAAKVVVFLSAADAAVANLDAIDEQVAWTGAVELAATKTIVMSLVGTGVTAVNLLVTITYHSVADGGYLA